MNDLTDEELLATTPYVLVQNQGKLSKKHMEIKIKYLEKQFWKMYAVIQLHEERISILTKLIEDQP